MPEHKQKFQQFDHNSFQLQLEDILFLYACDEESEGCILRAWELAQGAMALHACVDQTDEQTDEDALRSAWYDFWRIFKGEPATWFYWGIYNELLHACDATESDLDEEVAAIGDSCLPTGRRSKAGARDKTTSGSTRPPAGSRKRKSKPTKARHLKLVD